MNEHLITIAGFVAGVLAIVVGTYGQIVLARLTRWSQARLKEAGCAKAALLDGKSIPEAVKLAIMHTLASNAGAAAGLNPDRAVLERLAKAAVVDAAGEIAKGAQNKLPLPVDDLAKALNKALGG